MGDTDQGPVAMDLSEPGPGRAEGSAGPATASGDKFEIRSWNAVAMWSWGEILRRPTRRLVC